MRFIPLCILSHVRDWHNLRVANYPLSQNRVRSSLPGKNHAAGCAATKARDRSVCRSRHFVHAK
jgi:hypothetical protein